MCGASVYEKRESYIDKESDESEIGGREREERGGVYTSEELCEVRGFNTHTHTHTQNAQ